MPVRLNELIFRGRLTAQDLADIQWYRLAIRFPKAWRLVTGILLKAAAVACLYGMIEYGASIALAWGFLLSTAAALQMLSLPVVVSARAKDYYRKHAKDYLETVVCMTDGGVAIENERTAYELSWEAVALVADTPRGLMFCGPRHSPLLWIPTRVFGNDITRDEVRVLLETVGVDVRQVS